jgi:UDP-glucose 4-epimerase
MQRVAITGSSGYYGRHLIGYIRRADPGVEILGLDVMPPREAAPDRFAPVDVRSPELARVLAEFRPDTVVHLAFIVQPIHDAARMHDININGSRNVFDAVAAISPKRFLVASSATAFGAWPDNPLPIDDRRPVRGRPEFQYAHEKTLIERMLVEFADRCPAIAVSWVRPCIIYGPGVDNFLSNLLLNYPLVALPDGCDVPQQYVHEDDVAAATWCILKAGGRGPYNVAPPDWILLTDVARETRRRAISLPVWMMKLASKLCWGLRLPLLRVPPTLIIYVRYPWVVAPTRLCRELGFRFQYSSLETLRALLRSQGKLANDPDRIPVVARPRGLRRAG